MTLSPMYKIQKNQQNTTGTNSDYSKVAGCQANIQKINHFLVY